jgi:pimeloyl-ACP methyl ester carboxylesterase
VISATPVANRDASGFTSGTLSHRVDEVERLVTAIFERMVAPGTVDIGKIGVVGHGLGGCIAVAQAACDSRVRAVVAVAAPRSPEAYFSKDALEAWASGRVAKLKDREDGTIHALDASLVEDWRARPELDHSFAATRTDADVVWIHGTADEVVSADESRRSYWKHPDAGRRARLVEVAGAGHDFTNPDHARKLVDAISEQLAYAFSGK